MTVTFGSGQQYSFLCDQLYTLIGYGHRQEDLEAMGMWVTDPSLGIIAADYDGEIQRIPGAFGRARLYPGYFALGALLRTPHNPNASVIAGMLYRLADQFASVVLRSVEYRLRHPVASSVVLSQPGALASREPAACAHRKEKENP